MNQAFTDTIVDVGGRPGVVRRVRGHGLPLVLIPGCGGDHHALDPLLACLPGREVVVVCLPGRSGVAGPAPTSAADAASYVGAVLSALGIGRAVIGGHSYGATAAQEWTTRRRRSDPPRVMRRAPPGGRSAASS